MPDSWTSLRLEIALHRAERRRFVEAADDPSVSDDEWVEFLIEHPELRGDDAS